MGTMKNVQIRQVIAYYRFNYYELDCKEKYKLWSYSTSYCLIEVVTKASLTEVQITQ